MNYKSISIALFIAGTLTLSLLSSCDDDPALPDNIVAFEAHELGFEGDETLINVTLSRAEITDIPVTISLTADGVTYGTDFTTEPDGSSGTITLNIPSGNVEASVKVIKPASVFLNGDESISFAITGVEQPVVLGERAATNLSFSAITSEGGQLQLSGKTEASAYANMVFVDLSANKQTIADRRSWNLAFYNGSEFRVALNYAYQSTAAPLEKTDINTVTLADADNVLNLNHDIEDPNTLTLADYWDGDLMKTAFAEISANSSENKVYLLSFEGSKSKDQWFKVKVDRKDNGYIVRYARITETTVKTIEVPKIDAFNFMFVSLETGNIVAAEPEKDSWDIEWSYGTSNSGLNTPYWFQDFVSINYLAGVEAAEVIGTDATDAVTKYNALNESGLSGLTFLKTRDAIGSKWRVTGGPGMTPGVRTNRFYVIKDPRGNVYKLKFVSAGIGNDGGERGRPVIEYILVKEAE